MAGLTSFLLSALNINISDSFYWQRSVCRANNCAENLARPALISQERDRNTDHWVSSLHRGEEGGDEEQPGLSDQVGESLLQTGLSFIFTNVPSTPCRAAGRTKSSG